MPFLVGREASHQEAVHRVEQGGLAESARGLHSYYPPRKPRCPHLYNGQGSSPGPNEAETKSWLDWKGI